MSARQVFGRLVQGPDGYWREEGRLIKRRRYQDRVTVLIELLEEVYAGKVPMPERLGLAVEKRRRQVTRAGSKVEPLLLCDCASPGRSL